MTWLTVWLALSVTFAAGWAAHAMAAPREHTPTVAEMGGLFDGPDSAVWLRDQRAR